MERTPSGTPVGVDDPYAVAGRCDHLTDDGRCRLALEGAAPPEFAAERRIEAFDCVAAAEGAAFRDCPHYRSTTSGRECARCGMTEVRLAHDDARPLVEEHHLSYALDAKGDDGTDATEGGRTDAEGDDRPSHEITVALCRWCHAKVHESWARVDDDVAPDPEATAAREARRSRELAEAAFETARERRDEADEAED
ncbi:MAG: hypothetical protein ABEJ30_07080 [Halorientalis sp.]